MLNTKLIYELMDYKGIKSVKELSRKCKVPYTTLNYMFLGHDMYVSSIIEVAHFFNVPIDYLINKSYGIKRISENKEETIQTTSLIEAAIF